ncbi:hypothetical protein AK812_SmicGene28102 [Symbiodinium microadriaticum]|uniref:Uncharacterized protein n=1 Tax=Symbiodinium microadriaticum TaxID=2951 RepID=A0A1Q9D572_SYMMI|nr:hypothetical protein AK812_SmicGene28102 [Symbiodinium microadriaticum]
MSLKKTRSEPTLSSLPRRQEWRRLMVNPPERSTTQLVAEPLVTQSTDPLLASIARSAMLKARQEQQDFRPATTHGKYWWNQKERKVNCWR